MILPIQTHQKAFPEALEGAAAVAVRAKKQSRQVMNGHKHVAYALNLNLLQSPIRPINPATSIASVGTMISLVI